MTPATQTDEDVLDAIQTWLRTLYGGKRWLVAFDVLAAATPVALTLRELGAERCLCIAGTEGVGPAPDPDFAPDPIVLGITADTVLEGIRASLDGLANLSPEHVARVDAFDPAHTACAIPPIFGDGRPVAGRRVYGARPAAWQALEDKTTIDALWDRLGVPHARAEVVPVELDALRAAAARLDEGHGTAWAGDSRDGFHGGAELLRHVRSDDDARAATAFFTRHCDRLRVMPFLEGIPCSIHGMVFDDSVLAFRPCEMLVFRRPGSMQLHYGQAATFWDPPRADRDTMRALARQVGAALRDEAGFRGIFTLDGILTTDGFRPTEVNPRMGAAVWRLTAGLPTLPMMLVNLAVVEGAPLTWSPEALETRIVAAADAHRSGGTLAFVSRPVTGDRRTALVIDESLAVREALPDETPDATVLLGPAAQGGRLAIQFVPERTPVGPSLAPRAVAALEFVDRLWALGIGPLEPAREVR